MHKKRRFILGFFLFLPFAAEGVTIPSNLSVKDQKEVIKILGFSTSSKILSDPYPLGGHPGFEAGVTLEVINTTDLSGLGNETELKPELRYPRVTIGKGLYYNIDFFAHFIPYNENTNISEWGGMIKWTFFEGKFFPLSLSTLIHASSLNVGDVFSSTTTGAELMMGITATDFSIYFGGGPLATHGTFLAAGPHAIVSTSSETGTISRNLNGEHSYVGLSLKFDKMFLAGQIDRYKDPAYSAKLGVRF